MQPTLDDSSVKQLRTPLVITSVMIVIAVVMCGAGISRIEGLSSKRLSSKLDIMLTNLEKSVDNMLLPWADPASYVTHRVRWLEAANRNESFGIISDESVNIHYLQTGGMAVGVTVAHFENHRVTPPDFFACPNLDLAILKQCPPPSK
jgi:hypothetical protein